MYKRQVPYLGIYGAAVTEEIAQKQGMPSGVYVMQVAADSPAMVAGIQSGDILQVIGSTGVNNALTYEKAVRESKVGNTIRIEGRDVYKRQSQILFSSFFGIPIPESFTEIKIFSFFWETSIVM